ncbi:rab2a member ras oncogene family [Anaeramoeba flamelloides]|uniref:Rab2a member ras oncogene family n=1 Tax=Anaeramoeba flamelloides TaxID=1746091 RepID=A0AAV7Z5P6_9EUKA|nr:rab2a member ras oncogene family [Anaeramoeba flamelloides]
MSFDHLFKFLVIGDSSVGKSCILLQFTNHRFQPIHDSTLGVEFGTRMIEISESRIKLQIWDTAGQETFKTITRSYYRGAVGCLLVYDITLRESFYHVQNWLQDVLEYSGPQTQIILVGNKTDLQGQRAVSTEEGKKFAEEHKINFIETSAKTANNIDEAFLEISNIIFNKIKNGEITVEQDQFLQMESNNEEIQSIEDNKKKKNEGCC